MRDTAMRHHQIQSGSVGQALGLCHCPSDKLSYKTTLRYQTAQAARIFHTIGDTIMCESENRGEALGIKEALAAILISEAASEHCD